MRITLLCLVGGILVGTPCLAQEAPPIIAQHYEPPPPSPNEITSPMMLEVSMGATASGRAGREGCYAYDWFIALRLWKRTIPAVNSKRVIAINPQLERVGIAAVKPLTTTASAGSLHTVGPAAAFSESPL
jgi:hypothetical protein